MKVNEGNADRVIRLVLGAVLLGVGLFFVKGTLGIVLDVLGVVALITGATGFCLLYRLFGDFSTKRA
ncbi:MAG: DUF2892 domain-containing protein [Coriobacteriia bacterium]|nr:DUF2892 domain-containing protein [Coriobacteriia bacterium]